LPIRLSNDPWRAAELGPVHTSQGGDILEVPHALHANAECSLGSVSPASSPQARWMFEIDCSTGDLGKLARQDRPFTAFAVRFFQFDFGPKWHGAKEKFDCRRAMGDSLLETAVGHRDQRYDLGS